jgi:hypothetical protein
MPAIVVLSCISRNGVAGNQSVVYSSLPPPSSFATHKVHGLHLVKQKGPPKQYPIESVLKALGVPTQRLTRLDSERSSEVIKSEVSIYQLADGEIRIPVALLPSLARIEEVLEARIRSISSERRVVESRTGSECETKLIPSWLIGTRDGELCLGSGLPVIRCLLQPTHSPGRTLGVPLSKLMAGL